MSEAPVSAATARKAIDRSLCRHEEAAASAAVRAETHVFVGYNYDHLKQPCSSCYRCRNCQSTISVPLPGYNWDEPTPAVDVTVTGPVADASLRAETVARPGLIAATEAAA